MAESLPEGTGPAPAPTRPRDTTRRIRLRLSTRRLDEARFLAALDERSEINGEIDHDFVRRCLVAGFMLFERMGNDASTLALYTNQSHHTQADAGSRAEPHPPVSSTASDAHSETPAKGAGQGVKMLSGLLGGAHSSTPARNA